MVIITYVSTSRILNDTLWGELRQGCAPQNIERKDFIDFYYPTHILSPRGKD